MSVGNAAPGTRGVKDRPIIWAKAMGLSKSQALVRHYNHCGNWQKQWLWTVCCECVSVWAIRHGAIRPWGHVMGIIKSQALMMYYNHCGNMQRKGLWTIHCNKSYAVSVWVWECECVCEASQCDWTCNVHGRNEFNQFKNNIKNPHHVTCSRMCHDVMPSKVVLMVWASKPLHGPHGQQSFNHDQTLKDQCSSIFQTPELSQNYCWLKHHDCECDCDGPQRGIAPVAPVWIHIHLT